MTPEVRLFLEHISGENFTAYGVDMGAGDVDPREAWQTILIWYLCHKCRHVFRVRQDLAYMALFRCPSYSCAGNEKEFLP